MLKNIKNRENLCHSEVILLTPKIVQKSLQKILFEAKFSELNFLGDAFKLNENLEHRS